MIIPIQQESLATVCNLTITGMIMDSQSDILNNYFFEIFDKFSSENPARTLPQFRFQSYVNFCDGLADNILQTTTAFLGSSKSLLIFEHSEHLGAVLGY